MVRIMNYVEILASVLSTEAYALNEAAKRLEEEAADKLAELLKNVKLQEGSLVFCGVGKSGLVGKKLAATFTSLGLPSYFLHPTEALHGDLGTLRKRDAIVFISYSGTTEELIKLMPYIDVPVERRVALLGNVKSPLSEYSGIVLDCQVHKEACINNQAPTTSSTLAMAMGDAMAVLYESIMSISPEDFATFHPGGKLGKSLRLTVQDLMVKSQNCAILKEGDSIREAIMAMTKFPLGACAVCDENKNLKGLIVEGDIRRYLSSGEVDLEKPVAALYNSKPTFADPDLLASKALMIMEDRPNPFSVLPVLENGKFLGLLRLHDLFKEGL